VICPNDAYHFLLHRRTRALDATGNANARKCNYCGQWDDPENLYISHHACFHAACRGEYKRNIQQQRNQ
jgi:recombinational DNA repair protein (RecF pathway)